MKKSLIPQYIQFVKNTFDDFSIGNIPYRIMDLIEVNEPDCTVMKFLIQPSKGKRSEQYYLLVYSFLQFKIQMLHNFSKYINIMNNYPFFVRHQGIGVVNEMINIAIDVEETINLKNSIETQLINEKNLSLIILDFLKGYKVIQDNKIIYPGPYDNAFVVSVETLKGKIGHINPRHFNPNNKIKNQSKNFLKTLYSILINDEISGDDILEKIGTRMPIEFLILYYLVLESCMPDFVAYYEKEMLNNPSILEFYKNCTCRETAQILFPFENQLFLLKYCNQITTYSSINTEENEFTMALEDTSFDGSTNKNEKASLSIFINSRFTNQEIFVEYFKFLNQGELLKAYDVIKSFEEEKEVDSITYLALSNTLCKIVENKVLNDYLTNLKEEDLIRQIELEKNSKGQHDEETLKYILECQQQLTNKKQLRKKSYEQTAWSSSDDSNASMLSEEVSSIDLLNQLQVFPNQKKLTLKQYTQKIKETYQSSINKNPYSVISYFNLSLEYCSQTEIDTIIKLLKKCLLIQNQDYEVLYQLSVLYWNKQNYKQALKYFKKQIFIKNFDLPICLNIYKTYQRLNKVSKAIYFFKKIEQKYPQFKKTSDKLWMQIEVDILSIDPQSTIMLT